MSAAVGWFEIYVSNIERAKHFYETVFQCKLGQLNSPEIQMRSFPHSANGGAPGALVQVPGFEPGSNSIMIYFSCEDFGIEESRVVAAVGQVQRTKMVIGEYGFVTLIQETEGNTIGLHSNH